MTMHRSNDAFQDLFNSELAQETAIFKLLPVTVNGIRQYAAPEKVSAVLLSSRKIMVDGLRQTKLILLLEPAPDPEPGDMILWDGCKRELNQVQQCRSLSGEIIALECTVL